MDQLNTTIEKAYNYSTRKNPDLILENWENSNKPSEIRRAISFFSQTPVLHRLLQLTQERKHCLFLFAFRL